MKLLQVIKVKSTGQHVRIVGFADPSQLPKRGEKFYESVAADFDRDSGIPAAFDARFKGKEPSRDALFCEWHEEDPSHPLRAEQEKLGIDHGEYVHKWFTAAEVEEL